MVFALACPGAHKKGYRYLGGLSPDLRSPDFVSLLLLTSGVWQESTSTHAHPSKSRSDWRLHISCALALGSVLAPAVSVQGKLVIIIAFTACL